MESNLSNVFGALFGMVIGLSVTLLLNLLWYKVSNKKWEDRLKDKIQP